MEFWASITSSKERCVTWFRKPLGFSFVQYFFLHADYPLSSLSSRSCIFDADTLCNFSSCRHSSFVMIFANRHEAFCVMTGHLQWRSATSVYWPTESKSNKKHRRYSDECITRFPAYYYLFVVDTGRLCLHAVRGTSQCLESEIQPLNKVVKQQDIFGLSDTRITLR